MAVTPLGNTIFINQNVNMVSNKVADVQNRFDLQNLAAASLASDEKQEVSEVRPTEEAYKIDPENEHEKQKKKDEQERFEGKRSQDLEENDEEADETQTEDEPIRHIDIEI